MPEDEKQWYMIHTYTGREAQVQLNLEQRIKSMDVDKDIGEVIIPTVEEIEIKEGQRRTVAKKLYPGYVVVRMALNDHTWFLVRDTSGIGDFTGAAGKPVPLSQTEVDRILASSLAEKTDEGEEQIKTAIRFKVGDRVRVKEGYFQNYEGELSNIDERNGRITVMINIFGRPNPVQLEHWQVEEV